MIAVVLHDPTSTNTKTTPKQKPYDPIRIENIPIPTAEDSTDSAINNTLHAPPTQNHISLLIRMVSASLNHRDMFIRNRLYPGIEYPAVLGSDGVGVIESIHDAASQTKTPKSVTVPSLTTPHTSLTHSVGDVVMVCPVVGWINQPSYPDDMDRMGLLGLPPYPGTFAQYMRVPVHQIVKIPSHLMRDHNGVLMSGAIPTAGITAYRSVVTLGQVGHGKRVLVTGVGGGVALFAVQFSVALGASVYVTSSTQAKIDRAVKLGAVSGALYTSSTWPNQLQDQVEQHESCSTAHGLFDVIIDGAFGNTVSTLVRLIKPGGTIVVYGSTQSPSSLIKSAAYLWFKHVAIKGCSMGSLKEFHQMMRLMEKSEISPVVDGVVDGLENIESGFEMLRSKDRFGKVVIKIRQPIPNSSL